MRQEFLHSGTQVGVWHRLQRFRLFGYVGVTIVLAIAFPLDVRSQNAPTPPLTLPPAVFPTNQAPAVSVPPLQPTAPATPPAPATPTQPPASVSPAPSASAVIEFGQPLPKTTTSVEPVTPPQSTVPTLEPAATVLPQQAPTAANPEILIPTGTQLNLRYPGEQALSLQAYQLRQEVLLLEEDLRDRNNQVIAPAGTPIIGYFETSSTGSRFIAKAIVLSRGNLPFDAQSANFGVTTSAETTTAQSPVQPTVTIQPGQILQVQLQSDWRSSTASN